MPKEQNMDGNMTNDNLYTYTAEVIRVIDGDTLLVLIDCGFSVFKKERIRLARINCPEMDTDDGKKAKEFVEENVKVGSTIMLYSKKKDSYGRYIGEVKFKDVTVDRNLSDFIINNQHAELVTY